MDEDEEQAEGWSSWAWSYVPNLLPYEQTEEQITHTGPPTVTMSFYCKKADFIFKVNKQCVFLDLNHFVYYEIRLCS